MHLDVVFFLSRISFSVFVLIFILFEIWKSTQVCFVFVGLLMVFWSQNGEVYMRTRLWWSLKTTKDTKE